MYLTVWYWVEHYDQITGWKQSENITITGDEIIKLSEKFDVAIMTSGGVKFLAIDQLGKRFRQR